MSIVKSFSHLFGKDELHSDCLNRVQFGGWKGGIISRSTRGLCWRLMLELLSSSSFDVWSSEIENQEIEYNILKQKYMPTLNKINADPLAPVDSDSETNQHWVQYYKNLEIVTFIKGDLDRLYMNGIDDEYFKSSQRQSLILNVLFVWQADHPHVAYRQGMHEIAAVVLYALTEEMEDWHAQKDFIDIDSSFFIGKILGPYLCEQYLESSTFWIFERIMRDLSVLYDPAGGADGQPAVVSYCTRIQEHLLRHLDPQLCSHLEDNYVQAQLYGMRWSRLLLGREFKMNESGLLRIWDYIFASCVKSTGSINRSKSFLEADEDNISLWPATFTLKSSHHSSAHPILKALEDFMLAMLLQIRDQLVEGDVNSTMTLLMRYPPCEDITPIVDFADMIRRGVLNSGAHIGPPPRDQLKTQSANTPNKKLPADKGGGGTSSSASGTPSWLFMSNPNSSVSSSLQGVGRRVSQTISAVGSVVTGSSESALASTKTPVNTTAKSTPSSTPTIIRRNIMSRRPSKTGKSQTSEEVNASLVDSDDDDTSLGANAKRYMSSNTTSTPAFVLTTRGNKEETLSCQPIMYSQKDESTSLKVGRILYDMGVYMENENEDAIITSSDVSSRLKILSLVLAGQFTITEYEKNFVDLKYLSFERKEHPLPPEVTSKPPVTDSAEEEVFDTRGLSNSDDDPFNTTFDSPIPVKVEPKASHSLPAPAPSIASSSATLSSSSSSSSISSTRVISTLPPVFNDSPISQDSTSTALAPRSTARIDNSKSNVQAKMKKQQFEDPLSGII